MGDSGELIGGFVGKAAGKDTGCSGSWKSSGRPDRSSLRLNSMKWAILNLDLSDNWSLDWLYVLMTRSSYGWFGGVSLVDRSKRMSSSWVKCPLGVNHPGSLL